jgi:uncharacterized protein (DUF1800 family)
MQRAIPVLAIVLAACGGGGGTAGIDGPGDGDLPPPLQPHAEVTADDIAHLLRRTQFAATPDEIARVERTGLAAYLDGMLIAKASPATESAALTRIEDRARPHSDEIARWWLHLMVHSQAPFREVMAMFWHDRFATSQRVLLANERRWMLDHVNMLRNGATGNLRQLLHGLAEDPVMLVWLDGILSHRDSPNENFARELWELFTLGVDNGYTEGDIREAARAFTGYDIEYRADGLAHMVFEPQRHDDGVKTVFGQSGNWGYRDIVDLTLAHRNVAEYVARNVFEQFCYPGPSDEIVNGLARVLRDFDWEIAPMLKVLLRSREFYSARSKQPRVKSPLQFGLGLVRATGMHVPIGEIDWMLQDLAQRPTDPPDVNGWPDDLRWVSAHSTTIRANFANVVVGSQDFQRDNGIDVRNVVSSSSRGSPEAVLGAVAARMDVALTDAERAEIIAYMNTGSRMDGQRLVLWSDPFVWDKHVEERVRGLIYILAQHPLYQVR